MLISIEELRTRGLGGHGLMLEFYPLSREGLVTVPASKSLQNTPYYAFGNTSPDALTIGKMNNSDILSLQDYGNILRDYVAVYNSVNPQFTTLTMFDTVEVMYAKYMTTASELTITGVASVIANTTKDGNTALIDAYTIVPNFIPREGSQALLDLESYYKAVMYTFPNIVDDPSTIVRMYGLYKQWLNSSNPPIHNIAMISSPNFAEFVAKIKFAVGICTRVNGKTHEDAYKESLHSQAMSDTLMEPYFSYMTEQFKCNNILSDGMIGYPIEDFYFKCYRGIELEHIYGTDIKVIFSPEVQIGEKTKSNTMF